MFVCVREEQQCWESTAKTRTGIFGSPLRMNDTYAQKIIENHRPCLGARLSLLHQHQQRVVEEEGWVLKRSQLCQNQVIKRKHSISLDTHSPPLRSPPLAHSQIAIPSLPLSLKQWRTRCKDGSNGFQTRRVTGSSPRPKEVPSLMMSSSTKVVFSVKDIALW